MWTNKDGQIVLGECGCHKGHLLECEEEMSGDWLQCGHTNKDESCR